jgi:hypothetical protein
MCAQPAPGTDHPHSLASGFPIFKAGSRAASRLLTSLSAPILMSPSLALTLLFTSYKDP